MLRHLLAALPALLLGACSAASRGSDLTTHQDSAGVRIMTTGARDRPLAWRFEPVRDLLAEHEVESVLPQGVATSRNGRVYILDGRREVLVLDTLGTLLRRIGRQGGGPGEFRGATALALDGEGNLYVADVPRRSFVRFTADGQPLEAQSLHRSFRGGSIRLGPAGYLASVRISAGQETHELERLVQVTHSDTLALAEVARPLGVGPRYASCPGLVSAPAQPPIFTPALRWAGTGADVFVVESADYIVDHYANGRRVESLRRRLSPAVADDALAEAELGAGTRWRWSGGECRVAPQEEVAARGTAPLVPIIAGIQRDHDGGLWVRRAVPGGAGPVDVFSPAGEYEGTLPADTPTPIAFVSAGTFLSLERDSLDVPQLIVYRVRRAPAP